MSTNDEVRDIDVDDAQWLPRLVCASSDDLLMFVCMENADQQVQTYVTMPPDEALQVAEAMAEEARRMIAARTQHNPPRRTQ